MVVDDTQVYINGVLYQSEAFPSDPKILFNIIDEKLRELTSLEYQFLSINRAENRFSNETTREQLMIFMKDVKYNSNVFLSDSESSSLRTDLINKINTISEFSYDDVEIRITRTIL